MSEAAEFDDTCFQTTDGDIAVINLESARRRSWSRFYQDPLREGIAETVVEHEQLSAQFTGDLTALDRLEVLAKQLSQTDAASARTALIQAQVASMAHRFAEARRHLEQAEIRGAPEADVRRLRLSIDQACGTDLDKVLRERRQTARKSGGIEDQVALGGLLADLREFGDADNTYKQALRNYADVSPFPVAWVCFQLGMLWGELVPEPQVTCAARLVRKSAGAIAELHEGTRTLGGNLSVLRSRGRRGVRAHASAFERRSGGALAARRHHGRPRQRRRRSDASRPIWIRICS